MEEILLLLILLYIGVNLWIKYINYKHKQELKQWKRDWENYRRNNQEYNYNSHQKPNWKENYSFNYDYSYMPYKKAYLLTRTEHAFFITLVREALKRKLLVCPKVRLEDIAYVTEKRNKDKYRSYVKSRHIDFILLNAQCETVAGIELDDPSHDELEATKTDKFKNELFKTIGVPLIRIKTNTDYITQLNVAFEDLNLTNELKPNS